MIHAETDSVLSVQREGQIKEVHLIHVPPDERSLCRSTVYPEICNISSKGTTTPSEHIVTCGTSWMEEKQEIGLANQADFSMFILIQASVMLHAPSNS